MAAGNHLRSHTRTRPPPEGRARPCTEPRAIPISRERHNEQGGHRRPIPYRAVVQQEIRFILSTPFVFLYPTTPAAKKQSHSPLFPPRSFRLRRAFLPRGHRRVPRRPAVRVPFHAAANVNDIPPRSRAAPFGAALSFYASAVPSSRNSRVMHHSPAMPTSV